MTSANETGGSGASPHSGSTTFLVALTAYAAVAAAALWLVEGLPTAVRIPLALPLLLFAPGYAILSALVPGSAASRMAAEDASGRAAPGTSMLERVLLSVVTSLAVVPMVALAVNAAVGVRLGPILAAVVGITLFGAAIAIIRSRSGSARAGGASQGGFISGSWRRTLTDPLTLVAVIFTIVLLGSSAALVVTGDHAEPLGTEFYVADDDASTSEAAYDLRIAQDEVANQRYTVVVTRDDGEAGASGTELDRFSVDVSAGDTVETTYRASDLESGATVRFLLYTGDAPEDPDPSSAHRTLRQTVDTSG